MQTLTVPGLKPNAAFGSAYLLCKLTANAREIQLTTDVTDEVIGAIGAKPDSVGDIKPLHAGGFMKLIAQGSIAKDAPICPSGTTDGAAQSAAGNLNANVIGTALHAAADGEEFLALVRPTPFCYLEATVGAAAAGTVTVTLQANGLAGAPGAKRFMAEIFIQDTGLLAADTVYVLNVPATGTEVMPAAGNEPRIIFDLTAAGAAALVATDVGNADDVAVLVITPINHIGPKLYLELDFNDA